MGELHSDASTALHAGNTHTVPTPLEASPAPPKAATFSPKAPTAFLGVAPNSPIYKRSAEQGPPLIARPSRSPPRRSTSPCREPLPKARHVRPNAMTADLPQLPQVLPFAAPPGPLTVVSSPPPNKTGRDALDATWRRTGALGISPPRRILPPPQEVQTQPAERPQKILQVNPQQPQQPQRHQSGAQSSSAQVRHHVQQPTFRFVENLELPPPPRVAPAAAGWRVAASRESTAGGMLWAPASRENTGMSLLGRRVPASRENTGGSVLRSPVGGDTPKLMFGRVAASRENTGGSLLRSPLPNKGCVPTREVGAILATPIHSLA